MVKPRAVPTGQRRVVSGPSSPITGLRSPVVRQHLQGPGADGRLGLLRRVQPHLRGGALRGGRPGQVGPGAPVFPSSPGDGGDWDRDIRRGEVRSGAAAGFSWVIQWELRKTTVHDTTEKIREDALCW